MKPGLLRPLLLSISLCAAGSVNATSLLDIYRAALENDPVFLAAEYQRLATLEARPQARSALLPQVNLGGDISRTNTDNDQRGTYSGNSINLTLSQTIYRHANYVTLSQADLQIEQANLEYSSAQQSLLLRSAERYFAVLAAQDNLRFARSEQEAIQRQLEQAERRFEVGLIAITDVKEAQARYDLAVAQEIAADNQVATAREALRALTGSYPNSLSTLRETTPLISPEPSDIEVWVDSARNTNLQLQITRLSAELAKKTIALERAARLPNTELIGSYVDSDSDGIMGDSETTQIKIQVTVPLYTGGLIGSKVRRANANFELARQQLDSQRRSTEQQTRDAYRNVVADISRVKALKQALISTQSGAEATQAGFDVGTRTAVEVLTALRETYRAQADYSSARYDYILNTLRLKDATGTLAPDDLSRVDGWLEK